MKKSAKAKAPRSAKKEKPDIVELVTKLRDQMNILEMKVDVIIGRLTIKPPEVKFQPEPPLARGEFQRPKESKQPFGNGGRVMHKAVCADCNRECEVPFRPREDRAVYCKECFAKRRSGGAANANGSNMRAEVKPVQEPQALNEESGKRTKPRGKKKVTKKAKKR